jgi:hypothetical protein
VARSCTHSLAWQRTHTLNKAHVCEKESKVGEGKGGDTPCAARASTWALRSTPHSLETSASHDLSSAWAPEVIDMVVRGRAREVCSGRCFCLKGQIPASRMEICEDLTRNRRGCGQRWRGVWQPRWWRALSLCQRRHRYQRERATFQSCTSPRWSAVEVRLCPHVFSFLTHTHNIPESLCLHRGGRNCARGGQRCGLGGREHAE